MTNSPPASSYADIVSDAYRQFVSGQFALAKAGYAQALRRAPSAYDARIGMAATLAQLGEHPESARILERLVKEHPDSADAWSILAAVRRNLGELAEAEEAYATAHRLAPASFRHHVAFGAILLFAGDFDRSRAVFSEVVTRHPHEPLGWSNYASALHRCHEPLAGLAAADRALALKPDLGDAHYVRSQCLDALGRLEECLNSANLALKHGAMEHPARFQRAIALMGLGRFNEALQDFESRLTLPSARAVRTADVVSWPDTVSLLDRTVLLVAEQGLGDTIQYARFADLIHDLGAKTTLQVQPALIPLLARCMPQLDVIGLNASPNLHDYRVPLMSIPFYLGLTKEAITQAGRAPYLAGCSQRIEQWHERIGPRPRFKVALACSGNPDHAMDRLRSIPLASFIDLSRRDVDFFLVQRDVRDSDRRIMETLNIVDLSGELTDFEDTAAVLHLVDLVITVDTSVAHLAGALGRPTWMLTAFSPDYRWETSGRRTFWYPSVRLFRQAQLNDWSGPLDAVARALDATLEGKDARATD